MIHRLVYYLDTQKSPICDLSFTKDIVSDVGALMNTFKALQKFSAQTAHQNLVKTQFIKNQQTYSAVIFFKENQTALFVVSEATDAFEQKLQKVSEKMFNLKQNERIREEVVEVLKNELE
ncbi:Hypothetical_protein [Hexamita inflata]|uniref:Hypothetical_protein n=1 Tax=Hexamita inflata TaxID=28002 RepID=A0AA86PTV5_9EUKA|nr:Hypothetical protein HINF_LOCUS12099 [Hexamita inflata]CAI9943473.1 Hypothetical protein HINF_LOCUS31118 [Hexamita inflata]CAI9968686.1 Hypothetical protein HINF_LOCUS56331 [Hexamita inflata]